MKHQMLTWHQRGRLWFRLGIRLVLTVLALVFCLTLGPRVLQLLMPFLLGWLMAILLDPVIRGIQRRMGGPRKIWALILVLILVSAVGGALFWVIYYAGREVVDLMRNWDSMLEGLMSAVDSVELLFARLFALVPAEVSGLVEQGIDSLLQWLRETMPTMLKHFMDGAKDKFMGVPAFVVAFLMFLMGTYFITADYPGLCQRFSKKMGRSLTGFLSQVKSTVLVAFGGYLKAQLLLSVGVFCILLLGFLVVGQSYALLLSLGLAVLDFIPLLGAGTVMVPWAVFALLTRSYSTAIAVMVIWGIIVVYRRVAEPKIVGDQTGLSPILSLISIYAGMKVAGVVGMILGPILVLVVLNLLETGLCSGLFADVKAAIRDTRAILSQRPEE